MEKFKKLKNKLYIALILLVVAVAILWSSSSFANLIEDNDVRIEENTYFDLATPYGYGGWLIEGNQVEKLFQTYYDWLENNGIICEFVRFHPILKNAL